VYYTGPTDKSPLYHLPILPPDVTLPLQRSIYSRLASRDKLCYLHALFGEKNGGHSGYPQALSSPLVTGISFRGLTFVRVVT